VTLSSSGLRISEFKLVLYEEWVSMHSWYCMSAMVHTTVPIVDVKTEMLYLLLGDLFMKNPISLFS